MKTAVIPYRVADFLRRFAPFDAISEQDLLDFAGSGRVRFHQSGENLCRQGDAKGQLVWIIQQGRVELLEQRASGEQLRDVLGEGDLLGLDRFVGDGACLYSARTASDVIAYGLAATLFESAVDRYPLVRRFLSARLSVSGTLGFGKTSWLDAEAPSMDFLRARLITIPPDASLADAAPMVVGSINGVTAFVDDSRHPVGILAPLDFCTAVQRGSAGGARLAARPSPPATAAPLSTRTVVRQMLRSKTEELAITVDGTPNSPLEGILTASELALFCGHDPMRVINGIRHAGSAAELIPLLQQASILVVDALAQPMDVDDCCRIGTEVVGAMAEACIRLASAQVLANGIYPPAAAFCWVMFGPSARGELLRPALPTIAAVYDDSGEPSKPEDSIFFAAVTGETLAWLNACGLAGSGLSWPEGSHPCMPLSEWTHFYSETIRNPLGYDLYARREFFDISPLSGDLSILEKLHAGISVELRDQEITISLLANDTLAHLPPLTFFRGVVLELDGAQRDTFDISTAAVAPITDAARVFAVARQHLTPASTLARLEAAQLDFAEHAAVFRDAMDAFRVALYYQALAGGSKIKAGTLGRFDQLLLKTAFASIQRLLELTTSTFFPSA